VRTEAADAFLMQASLVAAAERARAALEELTGPQALQEMAAAMEAGQDTNALFIDRINRANAALAAVALDLEAMKNQ
jgi:hypothetical protein